MLPAGRPDQGGTFERLLQGRPRARLGSSHAHPAPRFLGLVCLSFPCSMEGVQVLRTEAVCEPGSRVPASCRAPEGVIGC